MSFTCILLYTFGLTLRLAGCSKVLFGLDHNPANPGIGVNYYGKIQNTTPQTLGYGFGFSDMLDDLVPRDCTKTPEGTSCIQGKGSFQAPSFSYAILNQVPCDISCPYRHYNGTCITVHYPLFGSAGDCFFRFTPPYYDGFDGFRKSASGKPLPEPRSISINIFKDHHKPEMNLSFQFLSFGQLVGHDLSRAIQPQIDCCLPVNAGRGECASISVKADDPFYSQFNKTCINFQRSELCKFGEFVTREQTNGATAALDGSVIYGVNENKVNQLRTLDGTGRLKSTDSTKSCLLLTGKDPQDIFCPRNQESKCFMAGDPRVNQHASLTSMQTVWMREHNRIAKELKKMNPQWEEEKLFQEARKIVIAELQSITFQEFLPILLSPRILEEFDLTIEKGSKGTLYSPLSVGAVWHEFAHAAFRLHSMIPSDIGLRSLRFKDTFSNPDLIRDGQLLDLIIGSHKVPTEQLDRYMVKDLTDFLYEEPGIPYGNDLAATNIQRGRDHGIAPYVDVVKFCTERTINITSFEDLVDFEIMTADNAQLLKQLYESVEDVDMWVGMQLENHMPGSILGPSAVCISAKQFFFVQKADRLFFNHEGLLAPFTPDQRSTIKNCTLGRILCDNTDIIQLSKNPFMLSSTKNPQKYCEDIPKIDLSFWKENRPVSTHNTS